MSEVFYCKRLNTNTVYTKKQFVLVGLNYDIFYDTVTTKKINPPPRMFLLGTYLRTTWIDRIPGRSSLRK